MSNKEGWFSATGSEQCGVLWLKLCLNRDLTFSSFSCFGMFGPVLLTQSTAPRHGADPWFELQASANTECRSQILSPLMRVSSFDNPCSSKSHRDL